MPEQQPASNAQWQTRGSIQAIVFDVDGVLLDSKPANFAYYTALLERFGYPPVSDEELEYGHFHTLRDSIAYFTRATDDVVDAIFERSRDLAGYPYELAREPEGSFAVLEALAQEYSLGVMSSRIVEGIRQYLDLAGTEALFQTIVGYEDTDRHKPHPEPLLLACERLNVAPAATIYVGDAPPDMICARDAGAGFIAFGDAIVDAEHRVSTFAALHATIRALDGAREEA